MIILPLFDVYQAKENTNCLQTSKENDASFGSSHLGGWHSRGIKSKQTPIWGQNLTSPGRVNFANFKNTLASLFLVTRCAAVPILVQIGSIWPLTSPGKVNFAKFPKRLGRLVSNGKLLACTDFWPNWRYGIHFTDRRVQKFMISGQNLTFDLPWKGQFCEIYKTPWQACF